MAGAAVAWQELGCWPPELVFACPPSPELVFALPWSSCWSGSFRSDVEDFGVLIFMLQDMVTQAEGHRNVKSATGCGRSFCFTDVTIIYLSVYLLILYSVACVLLLSSTFLSVSCSTTSLLKGNRTPGSSRGGNLCESKIMAILTESSS